jgi:hypothetical protein
LRKFDPGMISRSSVAAAIQWRNVFSVTYFHTPFDTFRWIFIIMNIIKNTIHSYSYGQIIAIDFHSFLLFFFLYWSFFTSLLFLLITLICCNLFDIFLFTMSIIRIWLEQNESCKPNLFACQCLSVFSYCSQNRIPSSYFRKAVSYQKLCTIILEFVKLWKIRIVNLINITTFFKIKMWFTIKKWKNKKKKRKRKNPSDI